MATRTRVPTRTIEDILAGAIDVIDRADRLLGKIDLIRYMGILCGPANPIDTQIIVGGIPVDPRARTWVLNQLTDSVQVTVNDLLNGLTDPPTGTVVGQIGFTWNADQTVATMLYRDGGGILLFTLTFTYVAGNVTNIVRT